MLFIPFSKRERKNKNIKCKKSGGLKIRVPEIKISLSIKTLKNRLI